VIDVTTLRAQTGKDWAEMARKRGVAGWHAMRKDQLIRALLRLASARSDNARRVKTNGVKSQARSTEIQVVKASGNGSKKLRLASAHGQNGNGHNGSSHNGNGHAVARVAAKAAKRRSSRVQCRIDQAKAKLALNKDLALRQVVDDNGHTRDRLVLMVRDSFWLQAYWELSRRGVERARVAMGQHWHGAHPVLRLHEVAADGTTSNARKLIRQIDIHGGVNNWYLDVQDPPHSFQVDIGYLAPCGKFYGLARSNTVTTPLPSGGETFDRNWAGVAQDYDRIYALSGGYSEEREEGELREVFEEHLRRPMGPPVASRLGVGVAGVNGKHKTLRLDAQAEIGIRGTADSDARVTVRGEPVRLEPDGTFTVRFNMPDRRQLIPIVASSSDGSEQRTIVVAVERNTKVMEPVLRETVE